MAVIQLACPHCNQACRLENPPPGEYATCPACGQQFEVPRGSSAAASAPPASKSPAAPRSPAVTPPPAAPPPVRRLSRAEKQRRRQVRNLVLMIFGVVVLAIAVVVLGRL